MKLLFYIFLLFILIGNQSKLNAQSVEDFFHLAANTYINGKFTETKQIIKQALEKYPSDPKLKAILGKMKEEEEEEQKNENQEQGDNDEEQESQSQKKQLNLNEDKKLQDMSEDSENEKDKMDKKEAERILNALQDDEQESQKKKAPIKGRRRRTGKDW